MPSLAFGRLIQCWCKQVFITGVAALQGLKSFLTHMKTYNFYTEREKCFQNITVIIIVTQISL